MFRDFVVSYKHIAVHARDIFYKYRAVIDHQKDIVVMSGNKSVMSRYKADKYSDLMTMSLYIVVNYIVVGAMYIYKMGDGLFLAIFTVLFLRNIFH